MTTRINILYYTNWGINSGIARSTILPALAGLRGHQQVDTIILCTTEPETVPAMEEIPGVVHHPLRPLGSSGILKFLDLPRFARLLAGVAKSNDVDLIWCRGASAGAVGVICSRLTRIPFVVDSFEPHSQYMAESGTWSRFGLKYRVQRILEKWIRARALALLPVSKAYYEKLTAENIPASRLFVFPCVVDRSKFRHNPRHRHEVRSRLGIAGSDVVGIYAGKFGSLYYQDEAFRVFKAAFDFWKDEFHLIILTEMDYHQVLAWCRKGKLPLARTFISRVDHDHVPEFLSAADFAFSTIKDIPALRYCSPIKHGEYWAAGLPIVSTLLEGDDAGIIRSEGGGFLLDVIATERGGAEEIMKEVDAGIRKGRSGRYELLAGKYRDFALVDRAIAFVIDLYSSRNK